MELFDIIRVPFPYSDYLAVKTRPALVISISAFNTPANHCVTLMVTSAERSHFPLDVPIIRFGEAGLLKPSIVRMKLFTVSKSSILEKIGTLHAEDRQKVIDALRTLFPYLT